MKHVFSCFFIFSATLSPAQVADHTANDLLTKAIESRKQIEAGRVAMTVVVSKSADSPAYEQVTRGWILHFKSDKVRGDVHWESQGGFSEDYTSVLTQDSKIEDTGRKDHVQVTDGPQPTQSGYKAFHPRIVGLVPAPVMTLHQYGLRQCLLRDDYSLVEPPKQDTIAGRQAWICESRHNKSPVTTMRVWVIPEMDYAIAKIVCVQNSKDPSCVIETVESEYSRSGDRWFPKTVSVTTVRNTQLVFSEQTSVNSSEFTDVPDSVFTLAGLRLVKGREVRINGYDRKFWDGSKLVDAPSQALAVTVPHGSGKVWRVAAVVLTCATVVGALYITLTGQRRKRTSL